jgi:hypothetical protein
MVRAKPRIVELEMNKLEEILRRLESKELEADDYETIKAVLGAYVHLVNTVGAKETTIRRLRQMLFGAKTEKTAAVVGGSKGTAPASVAAEDPSMPKAESGSVAETEARGKSQEQGGKPKPPGHGRNPAEAYTGAEKIEVPHGSLKPGDPCPQCEEGTLYEMRRPGVLVRLVGQPPVGATVYYLQKLRCNLCGDVFTAQLASCGRQWSFHSN